MSWRDSTIAPSLPFSQQLRDVTLTTAGAKRLEKEPDEEEIEEVEGEVPEGEVPEGEEGAAEGEEGAEPAAEDRKGGKR